MTYQYLLLPGEAYLQLDGAGGVVLKVRSGLADEGTEYRQLPYCIQGQDLTEWGTYGGCRACILLAMYTLPW